MLQGAATDAEDGALPDSALTWRVIRHHNTHTHPFLPPTTGNNVTFPAPGPENIDAGGSSHLEIQLSVTDAKGRSTTVTRTLMPRTVRLDFASDPAGATLTIDNRQVTAPLSFVSWVNYGVVVQAASQVVCRRIDAGVRLVARRRRCHTYDRDPGGGHGLHRAVHTVDVCVDALR